MTGTTRAVGAASPTAHVDWAAVPPPLAYDDAERARLWRRLGADEAQLPELLLYAANPYRERLSAALPTLPLVDERHVAAWRSYAAEATALPALPALPATPALPALPATPATLAIRETSVSGEQGGARGATDRRRRADASEPSDRPERRDLDVLRRHFVQLRFAVRAGVSGEPAYRAATRRGEMAPVDEVAPSFAAPATITLGVHDTVAGPVPIIVAGDRADFVTLVRCLAARNEPVEVPDSMGACLVKGLTNWHRVELHRERWRRTAEAAGEPNDEAAWQQEMALLAADKDAYQDRLLLLSSGPYSAVDAAEVGRSEAQWGAESLVIRREHEAFHYLTLRLCGLLRSNLLDELLADMAGLLGARGCYSGGAAQRFLGVDRLPDLRPGARLLAYTGEPALSPPARAALARLAAVAAGNLERLAARRATALGDASGCAAVLLGLAQGTLEELADADAMERRWERPATARTAALGGLAASVRNVETAGNVGNVGNAGNAANAAEPANAALATPAVAWSCRATSPSEAEECLASFEAFARRVGLDALPQSDLAVVLDELLTNAARHAAEMSVELRPAGDSWELRLADSGPPFDPLAAPPPATAAPLGERVPGGVGILLVRRLAASLVYERCAGENRLRVLMRSY
jgi:anti-sigma regulatory factor (Ser/Thr protein kinase)